MLFFFLFLQNHLKDILASVVSRRKAYRLRDGHFKYAFGSNVTPQPYLRNSIVVYNSLIERYVPGDNTALCMDHCQIMGWCGRKSKGP